MGYTTVPINYRSDIRKPCTFNYAEYQPDPELGMHSYNNWNVAWGFQSRHPGGANFLFADGSVHFLPEDIDYSLYQFLGCCDDGRHIEGIP